MQSGVQQSRMQLLHVHGAIKNCPGKVHKYELQKDVVSSFEGLLHFGFLPPAAVELSVALPYLAQISIFPYAQQPS